MEPSVSQMHPQNIAIGQHPEPGEVHIFSHYFFKSHFNIILPSTSRSPRGFFPSGFVCVHTSCPYN